MADLERLKRALVNADRAGDIVAAQAFARQIRQQMAAPAAKADPAMNPTSDMNTFERFAAGAGKSITDAGRGLGQMIGLVDQKDIEESRRLDAPLMNTGAGTAGNIFGNVALLAPTAAIPGANTVTGATLINALAGAALTPGTLGERAQAASFSGLGGGAGIGAGKVISGAGRIANAAAMPLTKSGQEKIVGEVLRRAAGNNADDVISRLRGATELVPGSVPTAAEVADSGGIAALQRAMSAANPDAYAHRGMSNNAARVEALRGIAGDEQAMQAAISARKSATDPLYKAADSAVVTSDEQLREIMSRLPNGTIAQAQEIARMTNRPIKFGSDIPESSVATGRIDLATGRPVMQTTAAQNAQFTGRGIDLIKKAIDDVVNTNPTAAIGNNAKSAGLGVKQDLVNWADNAIPEYGQARQSWAEGTVPISQMQIGQELLNKLEPALVSYHPSGAQFRQAGSSFANALNDVRGNLVKNATGGIKRNLEDVMAPEQMATLNGIGADLSRSAAAADMGRGAGSNTFQNFAMDNLAAQSGMPPAVGALGNILTLGAGSKLMGAAKAISNKIYQGSDDAMKSRMADILLDPQAAATVMENSVKPGRLGQALQNAIGKGGVDKLNYGMSVSPGVLGSAFALPYGIQ
ncbi:hypothetical protein [Quatrionicoccus australiensis]|uniref:hypothetical protein n=1 Tax=Quatrionicoccus australiensis TaxID=138118 RepID=UPI001CFC2BD1|nr:hypothetical protein [Quatrionicoccus australiensis]MCB4358419.1 hypothetical protein [Quatrionicoccus australiensis]